MFLSINEVGTETTYQLGALTYSFVSNECKKMDLYPALKERVEKYKKHIYPDNPILTRLKDKIEALVERGSRDLDALLEAWTISIDPTLPPKISEDPRFIALQGFVACQQVPPRLEDARRSFSHVFAMQYDPDMRYLKAWYIAERESGYGFDQCITIANFIAGSKKYSELEKLEFLSRKVTLLFVRSRDERFVDHDRSVKTMREALKIHLVCYAQAERLRAFWAAKSEEYARNTAYVLFDFLLLSLNKFDDFFELISDLTSIRAGMLDPIEEPLVRAFGQIALTRVTKGETYKIRNKFQQAKRSLDVHEIWQDRSARERVLVALARSSTQIANEAESEVAGKR
jgi:hypothetical protein